MVGEDNPVAYRVVVRDTFDQYKFQVAAQMIRNGMPMAQFFLYCAEYVFFYHRRLKRVRAVFRKGAREIQAAAAGPNSHEALCRKSDRDRRRRIALDRFSRRAADELHDYITGEKT